MKSCSHAGWVAVSAERRAVISDHLVLLSDDVLNQLVNPSRLRVWSAELVAEEGRQRFLKQPAPPALPFPDESYAYVYREETPQEMLRVGFLMPELARRGGTLVFWHESRQLSAQPLTDCGTVDVVLASRKLEPNATWDAPRPGPRAGGRDGTGAPGCRLCRGSPGDAAPGAPQPALSRRSGMAALDPRTAQAAAKPAARPGAGRAAARREPRQAAHALRGATATGELAYISIDCNGSTTRGPVAAAQRGRCASCSSGTSTTW